MTAMARLPHTAGSKTRYTVNYQNWLDDGSTLSLVGGACTVALDPATPVGDVTVNNIQVLSDHLYFWVQGGSVSEVFTVDVSITDSRGEIALDTVDFFVVAP